MTETSTGSAAPAPTRELKRVSINLMTLASQASLPAFHVQLARVLGAGGYGLYTAANVFIDTLSVITLLGMDIAVAREVSVATSVGDNKRAVRVTSTALRVVLLSGLLVSLAVVFAAPAIAAWQHKPGLVVPLRTLVIVPVAYHAATVFLTATQARGVMAWDFWTRGIFQPLSLLVLTTLALRFHFGLAGACLSVALGMTLTMLLSGAFYGRELPLGATLTEAARAPTDWSLVRLGLPMVTTNLVVALAGRLDSFVLGYYLSSDEVGAYGACALYVVSLSQVRGAFYPGVCAVVPAMLAEHKTAELNDFLQRQTRWVAMLAAPLFVLFAGFGDGLLAVFGRAFTRAAPALAILSVGHLSSALSLAVYALVLSRHAKITVLTVSLSLVAQAVFLPLLIPRFGLSGAALSTAMMLVSLNAAHGLITWRKLGVHGLSWGLAKVLLAAAVGFAVGRAVFTLPPWSLAPRFFAGVGVAAAVYVTAVVALGLHPDERELARGALSKLRQTRRSQPP